MRKSAVSVRSGAGMPVHMTRERNTGGGEESKEEEGRNISSTGAVCPFTCQNIREIWKKLSMKSQFNITVNLSQLSFDETKIYQDVLVCPVECRIMQ